jgi:hypothetical protein
MIKGLRRLSAAARATSIRLTRDGWESTIGDMIARGAKGTDEDFQAILDYLSKNFLGEARRSRSTE